MIVSTFVSRPWIPFYNCDGLKDGRQNRWVHRLMSLRWALAQVTGAWGCMNVCSTCCSSYNPSWPLWHHSSLHWPMTSLFIFFKDTDIIREMKTSSLRILFVLAITPSLPVLSHVVFNLRSVLALSLPFSSNFPENKKAKMQMFQISQLCLKKT